MLFYDFKYGSLDLKKNIAANTRAPDKLRICVFYAIKTESLYFISTRVIWNFHWDMPRGKRETASTKL
jgi:hypothetical protein